MEPAVQLKNSDFKLETGTLEIGAGKDEVKFILDITDDELYEGDEELILEGRAGPVMD